MIRESLPSNVNLLFNNPVLPVILCLRVPKEPTELLISKKGFALTLLVFKLIVAPKAPAPLVEVPTPR